MKSKRDPRHLSRIIALQKLFNRSFLRTNVFTNKELLELDRSQEFDKELLNKIVYGIKNNEKEILEIVKKASLERPSSKINKIDLLIIKIAIYEGFVGKITPPKVSIDEAIELAKEFGDIPSSKFVSGVLGNLMK